MSSKPAVKEFRGAHTKLLVTKNRAALVLTKFQLKGLKMAMDKLNSSNTAGRGNFAPAAEDVRKLCNLPAKAHQGELIDLFHVLKNVEYEEE